MSLLLLLVGTVCFSLVINGFVRKPDQNQINDAEKNSDIDPQEAQLFYSNCMTRDAENDFTSSVTVFFFSSMFKMKSTFCPTNHFVKGVEQKQNPTIEMK